MRCKLLLLVTLSLPAPACAVRNPRLGKQSPPEPLPEELGLQSEASTGEEAVQIQVGTLLNSDLSLRYTGVDFRDEGVLAVYLRVENRSPTRILLGAEDCHLFGQEDGQVVEMESLGLADVAGRFEITPWGLYWRLPLALVSIPILPMSIALIHDAEDNDVEASIGNAQLQENVLQVAWDQRTLGPGGFAKGLLFFDWDEAEEFQDDLTLALDLRDVYSDWHTVIPVPVPIRWDEGKDGFE